jgi:hypothetical protein
MTKTLTANRRIPAGLEPAGKGCRMDHDRTSARGNGA